MGIVAKLSTLLAVMVESLDHWTLNPILKEQIFYAATILEHSTAATICIFLLKAKSTTFLV